MHFSGTAKVNKKKFQSAHRLSEKVCLRALLLRLLLNQKNGWYCEQSRTNYSQTQITIRMTGEKNFNWDYTKRVHKNMEPLPTCWCESRTQRANKTQLSAKSPIPFFFFLLFATLQRYSMFLLQVLQAAKALLFLFPHSFPFDGCSTCCLIFFVVWFCFLFQKWPWSLPLSALSKRAKFEAQGRSVKLWNTCQTHTKHCTHKKIK